MSRIHEALKKFLKISIKDEVEQEFNRQKTDKFIMESEIKEKEIRDNLVLMPLFEFLALLRNAPANICEKQTILKIHFEALARILENASHRQ